MEFKDLIKKRRLELGKTLEQVGSEVGVSKTTVQRWESGLIKDVRRQKIYGLSKSLNTTPEYLMGLTDDPTPPSHIHAKEKPTAKGDELSEDESKLSAAEKEWIQLFRLLSDDQRQLIRSMIRGIVQQIDSEE